MNNKAKKLLYKEIEKKIPGTISKPTEVKEFHTLIASGFVKSLWIEWKEHCKENYNDVYWIKVWSDHLKAQAYDAIVNQAVEVAQDNTESVKEIVEENDIPLIGDPREFKKEGGKR